jgi:sugar/nucleoside kinase (ribokinase family)
MAEIWTMGEILVEIMRPKADIPLSKPDTFFGPYPSGAPAIFINTAAKLGHSAAIIGGVGKDDFGTCVLERLQQSGVTTDYVLESNTGSTAVAFVTYFSDGSRRFIYHIDGTPAVEASSPDSIEEKELGRYFHLMGCSLMANPGFREEIIKTVTQMADRGTKISLDPNVRPELLKDESIHDVLGPILERTSVLLPGVSELQLISEEDSIDRGVQKLFKNPVLELVVVKQGKEGAILYSREQKVETPAFSVEEVDPTGAGDCFDAGFLCGLLEGKTLYECGELAAAVGALNATAFGPMEGEINPESIRALLQSQ